jgi:hypothetical protein
MSEKEQGLEVSYNLGLEIRTLIKYTMALGSAEK